MDENYIAEPLGLINSDNLKPNEIFICKLDYSEFPNEIISLFIKEKYLVIHWNGWNPFKQLHDSDQDEFPLESLCWIIDTIEQRFFKRPEEGGLPESIRKHTIHINNELIGINASANCCAEFQPGYDIWNASRVSYLSGAQGQTWPVPTYQFTKNGLLDKLKKIAEDYEKGLL